MWRPPWRSASAPPPIVNRLAAAARRKSMTTCSLLRKRNPCAFCLPKIANERIWYRYVIDVRGGRLPEIMAAMSKQGVHAAVPVEPWFDVNAAAKACPNAAHAYGHLLSLPLYPTLTLKEQRRVAKAFMESIQGLDAMKGVAKITAYRPVLRRFDQAPRPLSKRNGLWIGSLAGGKVQGLGRGLFLDR